MIDRTGQQLGNYRLVRPLGTGGFAEVHLGIHVHLGSQAALKLLHTNLATAEELERFRAEAQTIVSLSHPNIVRLLDFGVEAGTPYLVMDYAPNGSLRQHLRADSPLPPAMILPYLLQVAEALQYAHERKLVHRDVKPENILLGRNNEVLLTDFGIATVAQNVSRQRTEAVAGTAAYMAPEQLQGKPQPSSDLYALGVVVYEWLCGERPFQGGPLEVATQHILTPPPPLREKVPGIPAAIEQVVLTALAKNPAERFGNVRAFANAFLQACREAGMVYIISNQPIQPGISAYTPPGLPLTGLGGITVPDAPSLAGAPPEGQANPAGNWISSVTTHITPWITPPVLTPSVPPSGQVGQAELSLYSAETHQLPPASNSEKAAGTPPGAPTPPPGEQASTPPPWAANPPSAPAGASGARPQTPLPPSPAGGPWDLPAAKRQSMSHLARWLLVGVLVLLVAITSGILVIALGNNRGSPPPPGSSATAANMMVGSVTFSDTDPNDFSHPASTLVAALTSLRSPASGSAYFAWLCDTGAPSCTPLGRVTVAQDGSAVVRLSRADTWLKEADPQQQTTSLSFEITQELASSATPPANPSDHVLYSGHIQSDVLVHLRHELTLFPKQGIFQGNTIPLVTGLGTDAVLLQQLSAQLLQYQTAGDLTDMQEMGAYLINLIVGKTAAQDGDNDGDTNNDIAPGDDGVGLGTTAQVSHLSQGCDTTLIDYLANVVVHACNAAFASASPTLEPLFNKIQAAGNNIAAWIAQIRQIAQQAAAAKQVSDVTQGEANNLVNLADNVLNGVVGDVQNQDGVRQILTYVERMATITVSAV